VLATELEATGNIESSEGDDICSLVEQIGFGVEVADSASDDADTQVVGHTTSWIPFRMRM
jgi:hypothetical protein